MLFGISEMREFAKNHEDERIQSMMRKIEALMSKIARQHEAVLKIEEELKILSDEVIRLQAIEHEIYKLTRKDNE